MIKNIGKDFLSDFKSIDKKIQFILFGLFFISLGNYIIVPYLAVYLVHSKQLSISLIGFIISVRLLSQRGLTLFGGYLIDHFGSKLGMLLGVAVRALSFIILLISNNITFLFMFAILNGLGSALYQPSAKTSLALITPKDQRHKVFGARNIAINAGASLGPLLGAILFSISFQAQVLLSVLIYLAIFLIGLKLLPSDNRQVIIGKSANGNNNFFNLFSNKYVISLFIIQFLYFILYSQFELTLPIHVTNNIGQYCAGLMFVINAITVIFFQNKLSIFLKKMNNFYYSFQLGFVMTMSGFVMLFSSFNAGVVSFIIMMLGVFIFSVGEIIMTVMIDVVATEIVDSSSLGRCFSMLSLTAALSSIFANSLFAKIYELLDYRYTIILVLVMYLLTYHILNVFKKSYTIINAN